MNLSQNKKVSCRSKDEENERMSYSFDLGHDIIEFKTLSVHITGDEQEQWFASYYSKNKLNGSLGKLPSDGSICNILQSMFSFGSSSNSNGHSSTVENVDASTNVEKSYRPSPMLRRQ